MSGLIQIPGIGVAVRIQEPGARFLKVLKSFRVWKAITKILNLTFTKLFISHNFNRNNVNFHAKFNAYVLLCF